MYGPTLSSRIALLGAEAAMAMLLLVLLVTGVGYLLLRKRIRGRRTHLLAKSVLWVSGVGAAASLMVAMGLLWPIVSVQVSHEPLTGKPEEIRLRYVAYACGEFCPGLTELVTSASGEVVPAEDPFEVAVAADIKHPEDTDLAVNGNVFVVEAIRLKVVRKNRLTGHVQDSPSTHLNVLGWRIVVPYRRFDFATEEFVTEHAPVKSMTTLPLEKIEFIMRHYN